MDELDYQLETVVGTTFERLTAAFLRALDYTVKESGTHGRDGGWDARVNMNGRTGIAHASVRNDWRAKLREDAKKVAALEADRGDDYDIFVFVTNQQVTGQQELDMEDEIEEKYGWKLKLYHRQNLLGLIYESEPELADRYLDIDLAFDTDHLADLQDLRDERLKLIQARDGDAAALPDEPAAVLHVIPNGVFSTQPRRSTDDIPNPPMFGSFGTNRPQARGKSKYVVDTNNRFGEESGGYALLRNDGLYESVTTELFGTLEENLWVKMTHNRGGPCLDAAVIISVREALLAQAEMGFSGTASVWVTLLDAAEAMLDHGTNLYHAMGGKPELGVDRYTTEVSTLSIAEQPYTAVVPELEPVLSELWREFGFQSGTGKIEDGEWTGQGIDVGDLSFP